MENKSPKFQNWADLKVLNRLAEGCGCCLEVATAIGSGPGLGVKSSGMGRLYGSWGLIIAYKLLMWDSKSGPAKNSLTSMRAWD